MSSSSSILVKRVSKNLNAPLRILVIVRAGIGDIVMATPALRLLRKTCPGTHITIVVPAESAPLIPVPGLADEVIAHKGHRNKLLYSVYKIWLALLHRLGRYDICFLLHETANIARRIKRLSNIPIRICPSHLMGGRPNPGVAHATHVIPVASAWNTHMADYFQDIIQGFFLYLPNTRTIAQREMPRIADPARRATAVCAAGKKRVAFCFEGAPANQNRWPEDHFLALLGMVKERGWYAYAAIPKGKTRYTAALAARGATLDAFECADIMECCALLREADLLISVDTGQVHLAAAMNIPVISLGGPSSLRTRPYSPSGVMLAASPGCFDCPFADDCRHQAGQRPKDSTDFIPPCMLAITPDMVFSHACEMLEG